MERITWTKQDKFEVAELSFKIRQNPDSAISDIECVRRAMEALLPAEKQRKLIQMQQVDFVKEAWPKLLRGESIRPQEKVPTIDLTKEQATVAEADEPRTDLRGKEPESSPVYGTTKQWPRAINPVAPPQHESQHQKKLNLEDLTTEMLAQELVSRLLRAVDTSTLKNLIREEVNTVLERRLPGVLSPDEYVPEKEEVVERITLPKVCIIGLMSKQRHMLEGEYKGKLNLHFLEGSEGGTRIKNTVGMMDLTIGTNWIKGTMPSMKGVPNYVHADGMTSIRTLITGRLGIKVATNLKLA